MQKEAPGERPEPEQIALMKRLVRMSAERTQLSAERTLSVWVRTALALMVFGIVIDRFGLLLRRMPGVSDHFSPNTVSTWGAWRYWCC